jgi:hypothetical protein
MASEALAGRRRPSPKTLIIDPLIVVGAPRSGTSTLFAALSSHPELWSLYTEGAFIFDGPFHPRKRAWESHVVTEDDFDARSAERLVRLLYEHAGNLERLPFGRSLPLKVRGRSELTRPISMISRPLKRPPIRVVEKTIPNILRIRYLKRLFPGARFLHLTRHPRSNIAALYRGWNDPVRHHDFPLPEGFTIVGHDGPYWSFVLPPGWRSMNGRTLVEVCAFQWKSCHGRCLADVSSFEPSAYFRLRFEDLISDPVASLQNVARWAGLSEEPFLRFRNGLPRINPTRHERQGSISERELEAALAATEEVAALLGYA